MWSKVVVLFSFDIFIACIDLGSIKLNNQIWRIDADKSTFNYYNTYEFSENEVIKFTCSSTIRNAWIEVTSNAHEYRNISTKPTNISSGAVDLFLKLTKDTDGKQIECRISRYHENPTLIRILFKSKTASEIGFGFHINGELASSTKCKFDICFVYYYYDKENVTVESFTNDTLYRDLSCDGIKPTKGSKRFLKTLRVKNNSLESLRCQITSPANGTKEIQLKFIPNVITGSHNPIIKGMSMSQTLALFQKDETTMTILYEYYSSEVLDLVCVSKYVFPNWLVEDIKFEKANFEKRNARDLETPSRYTLASNETITKGRFWLQGDQKTAVISCISPKWEKRNSMTIEEIQQYRTDVILIRKHNKKISTTNEVNDEVNNTDDIENEGSSSFSLVLTGAGAAGVIALILVFGIILVKIPKRKPIILKPESNINYESLPEHKKGPMPVPSQWDEAKYEDVNDQNLDKMYTKAIPKSQRNNIAKDNLAHAMYAKPIPKHEKNAQVRINAVNATYTKPIPKYLRSREQHNLAYESIEDITTTGIAVSNNEQNNGATKNSYMAELANLIGQKFKNGNGANKSYEKNPRIEVLNEKPYANFENSESLYVNENAIHVIHNAEINCVDVNSYADDQNPFTIKNNEEYQMQGINFGEQSNRESHDDAARCYVNISDYENTEPTYCNLSMTQK